MHSGIMCLCGHIGLRTKETLGQIAPERKGFLTSLQSTAVILMLRAVPFYHLCIRYAQITRKSVPRMSYEDTVSCYYAVHILQNLVSLDVCLVHQNNANCTKYDGYLVLFSLNAYAGCFNYNNTNCISIHVVDIANFMWKFLTSMLDNCWYIKVSR